MNLLIIAMMTVITLCGLLVLIAALAGMLKEKQRTVLGGGLLVIILSYSALGFTYAVFSGSERQYAGPVSECLGPPYDAC